MNLARALSFVSSIIATAISNDEPAAVSELTDSHRGSANRTNLAKRISSTQDGQVMLNPAGYRLCITDHGLYVGPEHAGLYPKTTRAIESLIKAGSHRHATHDPSHPNKEHITAKD